MMPLEVAELPLRREQDHSPVLPVDRHYASASGGRQRARNLPDPSRRRIRRRLDLRHYAILALQAAGNHVVLEGTDHADERLAAARGEKEHLHQPFFLELLHALVELLVSGVLQANAAEVFG